MSRFGDVSRKPRKMAWVKFSSASSRIAIGLLFSFHETFIKRGFVERGIALAAPVSSALFLLTQIQVDARFVFQVIAQDLVDIGEFEGCELLDDLFGSCALFVGS